MQNSLTSTKGLIFGRDEKRRLQSTVDRTSVFLANIDHCNFLLVEVDSTFHDPMLQIVFVDKQVFLRK